jgi:hypothetical protein
MVVVTLLAFALGIALSQLFRVYVLMPFTAAGVVILTWLDIVAGHGLAQMFYTALIASFTLQSGFLFGGLLAGLCVRAKKPMTVAAAPGGHRYL